MAQNSATVCNGLLAVWVFLPSVACHHCCCNAAELAAMGLTLHIALFVHLYLADMSHFAAANAAYCHHFPTVSPSARACVEVMLPPGCPVMIEVLLPATKQGKAAAYMFPCVKHRTQCCVVCNRCTKCKPAVVALHVCLPLSLFATISLGHCLRQ